MTLDSHHISFNINIECFSFSIQSQFASQLIEALKKQTSKIETKQVKMNPNQDIKFTKLFINNRFVDAKTGKVFQKICPVTGKVLTKIAEGDKYDVDLAVEAALRAVHRGSAWRLLDASKRGFLLYRLADLVQRDFDILVNLETIDTGKVFKSVVRDVEDTISILRYYAGWADKLHGKVLPCDCEDLMAYTLKEPIGVVGLIATYIDPLLTFVRKVAPALTAGCTVIYKPSMRTPLTALYMAKLINEVGFPEGVFNLVTGSGHTVGKAIAENDIIRHITFTGRRDIARDILERSARTNLKKVSTHLYGKSPLIVLKDCDLDEAARIVDKAVFKDQGLKRLCGSLVYVHDDIYDDIVRRVVELARKRTIGNPFDKDTRYGALTSERTFKRILDLIDITKKEGGRIEYGGNRYGTTGWFVEPTIFTNITDDMKIVKDDFVGPIMTIMRFKGLDDIIEKHNRGKYGLAAGIITRDLNKAMYLHRRLNVGSIWLNTFHDLLPQVVFGGRKECGYGSDHGREAIDKYLVTKTLTTLLDPLRNERY